MTLRSKVMGLAAASHFIVNVGITEAGPTAFAEIKEVDWPVLFSFHSMPDADRSHRTTTTFSSPALSSS
jgi:hypothetical protein